MWRHVPWQHVRWQMTRNMPLEGCRRKRFFLHAGILQHVRPFSAGPGVAVLEMLSKVIGAEELFGLVAFAEFVNVGEMSHPGFPVWLRLAGEFLAAIAANVRRDRMHRRRRIGGIRSRWDGALGMEGSGEGARKGSA